MEAVKSPRKLTKPTDKIQVRQLTKKETEELLKFDFEKETKNALFMKNIESRFLKLLEPKEPIETIEDKTMQALENRFEKLKQPTDLKLEKRLKNLYSNEAELTKVETLLAIEETAFIATEKIAKDISSIKALAKEDREVILGSINKVQTLINKDIERLDKRFDQIEDTNREILSLLRQTKETSMQVSKLSTQQQLNTFVKAGVRSAIKQTVLFPFTVLNFVLFAPAGRGFQRLTGPFRAIWDIIAFFILMFIFLILAIQLNHHFPSIYSAILNTIQLIIDASLGVIYKSYGLVAGEVPEALSIVKQTGKEYLVSVKDYLLSSLQSFGDWIIQYIIYFMKIAVCQGSATSAYLMGINCSALGTSMDGSGRKVKRSKRRPVSKKKRKTKSVKRKMKSVRLRK